jgi:hypothetical protein
MDVHMYAIRLEATQLVAAEVLDQTAATLLEGGQPILLATETELIALARRKHKSLTILFRLSPARAQPHGAARVLRRDAPVAADRARVPPPSLGRSGSRPVYPDAAAARALPAERLTEVA